MDKIEFKQELRIADLLRGNPKTREDLGNTLVDGKCLDRGLAREPGPVLLEDPVHPHRHLVLEELHVLCRVVVSRTHRVSFAVGPTACVDDMEDSIGLPEVVEELVPETLALVCIRYEPGDIDEIDGDKPDTIHAVAARMAKALAGTGGAHVRNAKVGVDGRERVVGDLCIRHGGRLKKGRLSAVWFTCKREGDHRISSKVRISGSGRTAVPAPREHSGNVLLESDKVFHGCLLKGTYGIYRKNLLLF